MIYTIFLPPCCVGACPRGRERDNVHPDAYPRNTFAWVERDTRGQVLRLERLNSRQGTLQQKFQHCPSAC